MALGFLRRHQRWLYVFLWIVILGFIVFYIPAFRQAGGGGAAETVAQVGGVPVTVTEFQRAYLMQRQRLEQLYQGRLDAETLRRFGLEQQVLEALVTEKLVQLEAGRLGLTVADATLASEIARMPGLQEGGRFVGAAEYRRRLEMQGRSVQEFEEALRAALLRQRLEALVAGGASVSPAEVEREFDRRNEQVRVEYAVVDSARFRAQQTASDDELKARFEARREAYRVPEKRVVSYVLVDDEALAAQVSVTDRDLETYYDAHKDDYRQPEQACARHILVKVKARPEDKEGHPEADARRLAEGLLAQLGSGADFAGLARKASEDKGSAENGGDLGCFPRGAMKPEFENAAFALEPGATSGLVKTDYGFHIIRLGEIKPETTRPLIELKDAIRRSLLRERAAALRDQKAAALAAALGGRGGLEQAAQRVGLSVQKSAPLARGEAVEPLGSPALVARAFEMKAGEVEREGFPVRRGVAFIALAEVQPAHLPELKEAQERVRADLLDEKAAARALELAQQLRARAEKEGLDKAAAALALSRRETPSLVGRGQPLGELGTSFALEQAVYALPEKTLSDPVRTEAGWALVRVLEKKAPDPVAFEKQKASLTASLRQERRDQLFQAFLEQARARFPVERNPEVYARLASR